MVKLLHWLNSLGTQSTYNTSYTQCSKRRGELDVTHRKMDKHIYIGFLIAKCSHENEKFIFGSKPYIHIKTTVKRCKNSYILGYYEI